MRGSELEYRNENNETNANNVSQIRISPRILPELLLRLQDSVCREEFEIGLGISPLRLLTPTVFPV